MIGREILRSKKDARLVQKKLLMSAKWPKAFRVLGARLTSSQLQGFCVFQKLVKLDDKTILWLLAFVLMLSTKKQALRNSIQSTKLQAF